MARTIPLHPNKGDVQFFAIVEDQDYESLKEFRWFVIHDKNTHYAIRTFRVEGKRFTLSMHRQITNAKTGDTIDHRDGNGLHQLRHNLRSCSSKQNSWNQGICKANKSGCKGVIWSKRKNRWRAYIGVDYKRIEIGQFKNFDEAVSARKLAEKHFYGDFARAA